jgi:low temperature requirement protein LtrA
VPEAFGDHALLFALAYLAIRVLHIALFATGTEHATVREATRALAPPAITVPAFLIAAAFLDSPGRELVWLAVVLADLVTGGVRGIEGFRLSPGH